LDAIDRIFNRHGLYFYFYFYFYIFFSENLEGGTISQGLADLTGGTCEELNFAVASVRELAIQGILWDKFDDIVTGEHLMGCGYGDPEAAIEGAKSDGILANHAYGVIDCKEINGFRLLKCRNP
jgi:calpain-15